MITPRTATIIVGLVMAYVLAVALLTGPLHDYVPRCPVTFGFCMKTDAQ